MRIARTAGVALLATAHNMKRLIVSATVVVALVAVSTAPANSDLVPFKNPRVFARFAQQQLMSLFGKSGVGARCVGMRLHIYCYASNTGGTEGGTLVLTKPDPRHLSTCINGVKGHRCVVQRSHSNWPGF